MNPREACLVAGVMSGTSADGVDVAVCRIAADDRGEPRIEVLHHQAFPYRHEVREAVLGAMAAPSISVAELSQLNWLLGAVFADAVEATCAQAGLKPQLVGCHGQTIYHQAVAAPYLGEAVRATWQTGEAAVLAERLRCPVVSDFRPADLAAGGQGAPLVPMLDWTLFRSATTGRVLANLGGIANLTVLPASAGTNRNAAGVLAFDTGPANMVMDGCMRQLRGAEFDARGALARSGSVLHRVLKGEMQHPFFALAPPKSCGREEFGMEFCDGFLRRCREAGASDADVMATAAALTVESTVAAYDRFVAKQIGGPEAIEFVAAGGGVRNDFLMEMLTEKLAKRGVQVRRMEELGVAAEAKEAVAFALLAWLTWRELPGNVPTATGACRPVRLGKICFG